MLSIDPIGVRKGTALILFGKSVFEKHPNPGPLADLFVDLGSPLGLLFCQDTYLYQNLTELWMDSESGQSTAAVKRENMSL